jgi:mannose-1-phosphate guanylyltransferase/mannose-6-phosphate isomerase
MIDHIPPSQRMEEPRGSFERHTRNLPCTVKIITVAPGGTLSRQDHNERGNLWDDLIAGAKANPDGEVPCCAPEMELFIRSLTHTSTP